MSSNWTKIYPRSAKQREDDFQSRLKRVFYTQEPNPSEPNGVVNARYTLCNFVPMFFYGQLARRTNQYFILMAFLQMIGPVSDSGGIPTYLVPLLAVSSLAMIRDAVEDYKKHVGDADAKNAPVLKLDEKSGEYVAIRSAALFVGDIVKVRENEQVLADLVLFDTFEGQACEIETKNIDGETNLKQKLPLKAFTIEKSQSLSVGEPNGDFADFAVNVTNGGVGADEQEFGDADNLIMRGVQLRRPAYILGVVCYVGRDCKLFKNLAGHALRPKTTRIEIMSSTIITILIAVQIFLCAIYSMFALYFQKELDKTWYLGGAVKDSVGNLGWDLSLPDMWEYTAKSGFYTFAVSLGSIFLTLAYFVPIILNMVRDFISIVYSWIMKRDIDLMVAEDESTALEIHTAKLIEEMGCITSVFTDKTGTLTQNSMSFSSLVLSNHSQILHGTVGVGEFCAVSQREIEAFKMTLDEKGYLDYIRCIRVLATCHTVTKRDRDSPICASSPDERALIEFVSNNRFKVAERTGVSPIWFDNGRHIEISIFIPFDSDRKRMTVVCRMHNRYFVCCKGADLTVLPLCINNTTKVEDSLQELASQALRCLVLAYREVDKKEYGSYIRDWKEYLKDPTKSDIISRIESNFECVGATGVRDKLRPGVERTLQHMIKANIAVSMLTGDNVETAINIGRSCGLIGEHSNVLVFASLATVTQTLTDLQFVLMNDTNTMDEQTGDTPIGRMDARDAAIVLAQPVWVHINESSELSMTFWTVVQHCRCVILSRATPHDKAAFIESHKYYFPEATTMAVGDGANDVGMLQVAHVAVAIRGVEGGAAVENNADFVCSEFRHLRKLIFYHGRESFRRNTTAMFFIIAKNVAFGLPAFIFGFYCVFSGVDVFNPIMKQFYNLIFTLFPIIIYACTDEQLPSSLLTGIPNLYRIQTRCTIKDPSRNAQRGYLGSLGSRLWSSDRVRPTIEAHNRDNWDLDGTLSYTVFCLWSLLAAWIALISTVLPELILSKDDFYTYGEEKMYVPSFSMYQNLVMLVQVAAMNAIVILLTNTHYLWTLTLNVLSTLSFFVLYYVLSSTTDWFGVTYLYVESARSELDILIKTSTYIPIIIVVTVCAVVPVAIFHLNRRVYYPAPTQILKLEHVSRHGGISFLQRTFKVFPYMSADVFVKRRDTYAYSEEDRSRIKLQLNQDPEEPVDGKKKKKKKKKKKAEVEEVIEVDPAALEVPDPDDAVNYHYRANLDCDVNRARLTKTQVEAWEADAYI